MITLADINEQLDTVTFVETFAGSFRVEGLIPTWVLAFCPNIKADTKTSLADSFVFLGGFIEQAHEEYTSHQQVRIGSGPWTERDNHNVEQNLSALAVFVKGALVVQISLIPDDLRYHQRIFQKAREYSLEFEQARRAKERQEVLIHAIVHDLSIPLTTIDGALHVLSDSELSKALSSEEQEKLELLVEGQISNAQDMVNSILDLFQSDHKSFRASSLTEADAPTIVTCIEKAVANFSPVFKQEDVLLKFTQKLSKPEQKVIAEGDQLERVISNLLENALRYSPKGSSVNLTVEDFLQDHLIQSRSDEPLKPEAGQVKVSITDEGPGVPEELSEVLFERFTGGQAYGERGGLGLYYCQMCMRRWGGEITYVEPQESGGDAPSSGASFRVVLSKFL